MKAITHTTLIMVLAIFIILVGTLVSLRFVLYPSICGALPFGHDYTCFAKKVDTLYTTKGSTAAFTYFDSITSDLNYGAAHLIAHQLGHSIWEDSHDLHTAIAQVPYTDYSATEIFRHGGALHGIFHSYFLSGTQTEDVHSLISHSCSSLQEGDQKELLKDCAHGVGHGLMTYTNNDVREALLLCKESIQPENCYKGAFMERGLLYIPGYANTQQLEDIEEVCASLNSEEGVVCAQYVGWTAILKDLVQKQESDTTEALKVCEHYSDDARYGCVYVAVRDLFSIVYDNDADAMQQACEQLPDRETCEQGLAEWKLWDRAYRGLGMRE